MIGDQPTEKKAPCDGTANMSCSELRALSADLLEITIGALRKIMATEDNSIPVGEHARCISIAGNAVRAVQYKIEDAKKT